MTNFIFHHNDLDGHVSREIVKRYLAITSEEEVICREINYGMEFDDHDINYDEDKIYMVDFCLQPEEQMIQLIKRAGKNLVWIDHHKTSAELLERNPEIGFQGYISTTDGAACELCWLFFFSHEPIPNTVKLIGQYDSWNHGGEYNWEEQVVPFKIWAETINVDQAFLKEMSEVNLYSVISTGGAINSYIKKLDKALVLGSSHRINLKVPGIDREFSTLVMNTAKAGSGQIEAAYSAAKYDVMFTYRNVKGKYWTIGMYSIKPDVDCSAIAKIIGQMGPFKSGGGHKGAAGCQVDTKTLVKILNL